MKEMNDWRVYHEILAFLSPFPDDQFHLQYILNRVMGVATKA